MAEFDQVGRDAFLAKYGFRPARKWFVEFRGKRYDSKAIAGAALGNQFPEHGPLSARHFSGGEHTVAAKLDALGFTMIDISLRGRHASDSSEQQKAEVVALGLANEKLSVTLHRDRLTFPRGVCIDVDGIDHERRVLCEVYCRLGILKPAHKHKVASDMLKLILAERELGGTWRKVICLVDDEAFRTISGRSWLKAVADRFGVELITVALPADVRALVKAAQGRQLMQNAVQSTDD
jgi:hypothetical protein